MDAVENELVRDGKGQKLQAPTRSVYQDAAAAPIVSPKTGVTTTPQAFRVPANAVAMVIYATAAGRFGTNATLDGSGTGKGYRKIPATTERVIPCAALVGSDIYVRAESGTIDVDFEFQTIGS